MTDIVVGLQLRADAKGFTGEVRLSEEHLKRLNQAAQGGQREMGRFGQGSERAGRQVADLSRHLMQARTLMASLGVGLGLGQAIRTIGDFQQSMAGVSAVTRATADELAEMSATARQLGATTRFSASEAAEGMRFLGMAGFQTSAIVKAMPSVLNLAAAAQLDLGRAADITSNIMSAFGIQAEETARIADALAVTAASANTDISQMGEAMRFVGPVANAMGISMEQTAAAVGTLSNAGIQAGAAGTGLRRILSELANPSAAARRALAELGVSMDEVDPKANSLVQIVGRLRAANMDASQAFTIFGDRGAPAILALTSLVPELMRLTESIEDAGGAAQTMARTLEDNLKGDTKQLVSALEELTLQAGDRGLAGALRGMVQSVTGAIRVLGQMDSAATQASTASRLLAAGIAGLGIGGVTALLLRLVPAIRATTVAMLGLNAAVSISPMGLIARTVGLATAAFVALQLSTREAEGATEASATGMSNAWHRVRDSIVQTARQIDHLLDKVSKGAAGLDLFMPEKDLAAAAATGLRSIANPLYGLARSITDSILTTLTEPIEVLASPKYWSLIEENFRRGVTTDWIGRLLAPVKQEMQTYFDDLQDGQPILLEFKVNDAGVRSATAGLEKLGDAARQLARDLALLEAQRAALDGGDMARYRALEDEAKAYRAAEAAAKGWLSANDEASASQERLNEVTERFLPQARRLVAVEREVTESHRRRTSALETLARQQAELEKEEAENARRIQELIQERQRVIEATGRETEETLALAAALRISEREYQVVQRQQQLLRQSSILTAEAARKLAEELVDAERELAKVRAAGGPLTEAFRTAAEGIQRGFSDAFFGIIRSGRLRFDELAGSIKDIFARLLAELATMALLRPVIVPMVSALGGAMGVSQGGIDGVVSNLGGGIGIADKAMTAGRWFSNPLTGFSNIGTNWAAGGLSGALFGQAAGGAAAAGVAPMAGGLTNAATTGMFGFGGQMTAMGALGIAGLAIGAIALASSLFKSKPSDNTASFQGLLDGRRWEASEDKANDQTRQLRDQIQQATRTSLEAMTQALKMTLPEGFYIDVATGSRDGNRFWMYDTGGESLAGKPLSSRPEPVASGRYDSVEDLIGGILQAVATRAEGLSETLRTVVEEVDFSDLESALQDIGLGQFYDSLGKAAPVVAEAQAAIDEVNERFRELSDFAERYGLALAPVAEGQKQALADLQQGFVEGLRDQILQLTDPVQYQIRQLDEWRMAALRNAVALGQANGLTGASTEALAAIQEYYAVKLQEITGSIEGSTVRISAALRSQYLDQISAVEEYMREVERNTERWQRQAATLRAVSQALLLDGNLSPLSPQARYDEARRQFDEVSARARLGDQDAIDDLPEISRAFLEVSRAFNGNAVAFSQDFALVQQALGQAGEVADRHARIGQGQLDQLRSQTELLRQQLETGRLVVGSLEQALAILSAISAGLAAGGGAGGGGSLAYVPGSYGATVGTAGDMIQGVSRETRDQILLGLGQTTAGGGVVQDRIANDPAFADAYREALRAAGGAPSFAAGGWHSGGIARIHNNELIYTGPPAHVFNARESAALMGGGGASANLNLEPVVTAVRETTGAVAAAGEMQARATAGVGEDIAELRGDMADLRLELTQLGLQIKRLAA